MNAECNFLIDIFWYTLIVKMSSWGLVFRIQNALAVGKVHRKDEMIGKYQFWRDCLLPFKKFRVSFVVRGFKFRRGCFLYRRFDEGFWWCTFFKVTSFTALGVSQNSRIFRAGNISGFNDSKEVKESRRKPVQL